MSSQDRLEKIVSRMVESVRKFIPESLEDKDTPLPVKVIIGKLEEIIISDYMKRLPPYSVCGIPVEIVEEQSAFRIVLDITTYPK